MNYVDRKYQEFYEKFVYEFLPSGIIECQTVHCLCCKEAFTDYVD